MDKITAARLLIQHMGTDPDLALAMRIGAVALLEPKEKPKEEAKESPKEKPAAKKRGRPALDEGKIGALYKAGWSVTAIADEMGVSKATIDSRLKKMDLKK